MGILKNLLVTGAARFVNTIKGSITHAQNGMYYGTCSTAAGTAAKVVELVDPTGFELKPGVMIAVKFTASNTASSCTINVEGTGAKQVWFNTGTYTSSSQHILGYANRVYYYVYDGTYWCFLNNSQNYYTDGDHYTSAFCETAAATAAKYATVSNYTLTANTYLHFNIRYANTVAGAITMNVGGSGAKPIYINGAASSASNYTLPAGSYIAFYNGTNWYFRTDGKLPADIDGDAATVNGHSVNADVPSGAKFTDTTYTAATTAPGNVASSSAVGTSTNYARQDHTHGIALATGDSNGQVKIAGTNVSVKGWNTAATYAVETTLANDSKLPTGAAVTVAINDAVDFGTVGSEGNPVYFSNGTPTPGAFSWGTDEDQNVVVSWDGETPEITPSGTALAISSGGTGATTAAGARTNLGLGSAATYDVVSAVQDDENLVTNGAVKRFVEGKGYLTEIDSDDVTNALGYTPPQTDTNNRRAFYGTCATAAATKDKVVTLSNTTGWELLPGTIVGVKFTYTNTYSSSTENPITLNVNETGAKNIWYNITHSGAGNTGTSTAIYGIANRYTFYMYDGTYWVWIHNGVTSNSNTVPSAQCETGAGTAAKVATLTNHTLTANTYCHFNIRYANTAKSALTMNVDSSGAKPIYINGVASSASNYTLPAGTYIAFYNGTYWDFRTDGVLPGTIKKAETVTGTVGIANGGTGATDAATARTNLGWGTTSTYNCTTSDFVSTYVSNVYNVRYQKIGNIVILNGLIVINNSAVANNTQVTIGTIPEGYRPNPEYRSILGNMAGSWGSPGTPNTVGAYAHFTGDGNIVINKGTNALTALMVHETWISDF